MTIKKYIFNLARKWRIAREWLLSQSLWFHINLYCILWSTFSTKNILMDVLQVDFMQGGQQTLRLTTAHSNSNSLLYFLQYLGCTVLQLSCPDRDFEAHTSQFQCAIHDAPCWSEGKARENIEHLHAPWSQRNATCSEKTVGKSMHYKDVHRIIGGGSRFQVSIPESFPLNKAEFRILNHSFTI